MQLASKRLGMPADQLMAADGVISAKSDPSKKISYGELIRGQRFEIQLNPNAKRKPASEWTVLGTEAQRPDLPALVTGQFEFVHNVRLPGMLHGRVVRPPAVGATVDSRGRKLGAGDAGRREGGGEEKFRRRGGGEAVAGNSSGEQVEGYLERRRRACRGTRISTNICGRRSRRATRCWSTPRMWTRSSRRPRRL